MEDILQTKLWEKIDEELAKKVNEALLNSKTYVMQFLALRGILQISVKCQQNGESPENFWGAKYDQAKKCLAQYGFSAEDNVALGQLNNVIKQIQEEGIVREDDPTCEICGVEIGNLDDGNWDWTGGVIACLTCIGKYGRETPPEQVNQMRQAEKDKEHLRTNVPM